MTGQSDFESLVGPSMSQPAVSSGMAGFFLAIRDCGLHFVDAEIAERHFRRTIPKCQVRRWLVNN